MTPKDKAQSLVNALFERSLAYHDAQISASFLAEVIVKELNSIPKYATCNKFEYKKQFWKEVKNELNKP